MTHGDVWLDAQGAQSRYHSDRGIPRYISEHIRALVGAAPERVQAVGIQATEPLTSNLSFLLGSGRLVQRRPTQPPPAPLPRIYHVMAPFDLDSPLTQVWPTWARQPSIATVVTLYDLIPLLFADHYLADPALRARYLTRVELVRAASHVLAISETTANDAMQHLGIPKSRITVIDAGVAAPFKTTTARRQGPARFSNLEPDYILYVGGIDFRKNVERLILAYARVDGGVRSRHQLVITCKVLPEERAALEKLAADAGLPAGRLILTGYVDDVELAALYGAARLFVFPSFYEGSALPILEAMAAELPVAAARASTSPELLGDVEATFDPFDVEDMAATIQRCVTDEALLGRLRQRSQRRTASGRYTWERVAERTLEAYDLTVRQHRNSQGRKRIAWFTPWPPERSGVADYSQCLVAALAEHVDVDVIVADGVVYESPTVPGVRLIPYGEYKQWSQFMGQPDRVVYSMGNSPFHGWIFDAMKDRPGVVLVHDAWLYGFHSWRARASGDVDWVTHLSAQIDAAYATQLGAGRFRNQAPTVDEAHRLGICLTSDVQERAEELIVHCQYAADVLRFDWRGRGAPPPVHVVPHAAPPVANRRTRPASPIVLSHGIVSEAKALTTLIEAFARVATRHPEVRLVLAGDASGGEAERWLALAHVHGIADRVELPGFLPNEEYEPLIANASVGVQLRLVMHGEASGAVSRNLAAGVPTIVTDGGWFAELPRSAVVHVPPAVSVERLEAEIERLLVDQDHADKVARGAQEYAARISFAAVARAHLDVLFPSRQAAVPAPVAAGAATTPLRHAAATVVVITHNRRRNVALVLAALERQTTRDFAVVVADDASTDGTRDLVEGTADTPMWSGRLQWVPVPGGPSGCSRPRNVGADHAAPGSSLLVFLDSDVLLGDDAMANLLRVHRSSPDVAIFPAVHWLPPLDGDDLMTRLGEGGASVLMADVPRHEARRVEGTIVGLDPRGLAAFDRESGPVRPEHALFTFAALPVDVWRGTGGFDEAIQGYGYEDMEMGVRLARGQVRGLMTDELTGLHIWHAKDDWTTLSLQSERNLDYVLRKHGPTATSDHWADFSVWWHYHADRGGCVVEDAHGRLWAVDPRERMRLLLPDSSWIERLGHHRPDVARRDVSGLRNAGVARDLPVRRWTGPRAAVATPVCAMPQ